MRALTVWQPRATLLAHGIKKHETRSWAPPHRLIGQRIAIHAAARKVNVADMDSLLRAINTSGFVMKNKILDVIRLTPTPFFESLPLGAVLGTAKLAEAFKMLGETPVSLIDGTSQPPIDDLERALGDFSPGRYAWKYTDIELFDEPIPAKGKQRLWEWTP